MRKLLGTCLAGLLLAAAIHLSVAGASGGDFYARLRANDAPIGGRFTIYAYMLDSLDVSTPLPGPGRALVVNFRESNGKDSFLIPGDLALQGARRDRWQHGFVPLGTQRIAGLLHKDESRWALWWVPAGPDSVLSWNTPLDLTLTYGFMKGNFLPLAEKDAAATLAALPWDAIRAVTLSADRRTDEILVPPNPAAFDQSPLVRERKTPIYPKSSRMYDFEGTVHVVVVLDKTGAVTDSFVLHSSATHDLNVAALTAVNDWVFRPGRKGGVRVGGDFVVPVTFSLKGEP